MISLTAWTLVSTLLRIPPRGSPPCNSPGTGAQQMGSGASAGHPQVIARPHHSAVSISSAPVLAGRGPAEAGIDASAAIRCHHCHYLHTQPDYPQVLGAASREPQPGTTSLSANLLSGHRSPSLRRHTALSAHPLSASPTAASVCFLGHPPWPASPGFQGWYLIHPCAQSPARPAREGAYRGLLHESTNA